MSKSNSLLLLPARPTEPDLDRLWTEYQPSITAALVRLSSLSSLSDAVLEVVVPCPAWFSRLSRSKSELFTEAQELLAGLYGLISVICEQNSIDQDGPRGLNVIVVITTYNESEKLDKHRGVLVLPNDVGPIVDLQTFSLTRRLWKFVFCVDSEQGREIFDRYIALSNFTSPPIQGEILRVQAGAGLPTTPISRQLRNSEQISLSCHTVVAVGGTFDHLHAGHKLLLTATALLIQPPIGSSTESTESRRLIVGITGDALLKNKKYPEYLMGWEQRQQSVVDFLTTIILFTQPGQELIETQQLITASEGRVVHTELKQAALTIECVEIHDAFGPTITDATISALVVSRETSSGGTAVNDRRKEMGWSAVEVFEVEVLDGESHSASSTATRMAPFAAKISSTTIREREALRARKAGA